MIILRVHDQLDGSRYKGLSRVSGFESLCSVLYYYQLLVRERLTLPINTHKYYPYYMPLNILSTCSSVLRIQM